MWHRVASNAQDLAFSYSIARVILLIINYHSVRSGCFVHPPRAWESLGGKLGPADETSLAALPHLRGRFSRTPRCMFMLGRTAASSDLCSK